MGMTDSLIFTLMIFHIVLIFLRVKLLSYFLSSDIEPITASRMSLTAFKIFSKSISIYFLMFDICFNFTLQN